MEQPVERSGESADEVASPQSVRWPMFVAVVVLVAVVGSLTAAESVVPLAAGAAAVALAWLAEGREGCR